MRKSYGYSSYRGRSAAKTVLTAVAILLLAVLVLLVGFFVFAQKYVVYYDDGRVRFEFPWLTDTTPTPTPDTAESELPVIVTPTPTPEPTPTPVTVPVAVELPLSALTEGSAAETVSAAGGTMAVFTLKDGSGQLAYASQNAWATWAKVCETDPTVNETLSAALSDSSLYTVARVYCFKDDQTPYYYGRANGLRYGENGNWRDSDGSRWFSPAAEGARDYLTELCLEIAALGFNELWLDYCTFPTNGNPATIVRNANYDPATLTADLDGFYAQVTEAVRATYPDVKISFTASAPMMAGEENQSGQTVAQLARYADRVYLAAPTEERDYTAALEELGFSEENVLYFGAADSDPAVGRVVTP